MPGPSEYRWRPMRRLLPTSTTGCSSSHTDGVPDTLAGLVDAYLKGDGAANARSLDWYAKLPRADIVRMAALSLTEKGTVHGHQARWVKHGALAEAARRLA